MAAHDAAGNAELSPFVVTETPVPLMSHCTWAVTLDDSATKYLPDVVWLKNLRALAHDVVAVAIVSPSPPSETDAVPVTLQYTTLFRVIVPRK